MGEYRGARGLRQVVLPGDNDRQSSTIIMSQDSKDSCSGECSKATHHSSADREIPDSTFRQESEVWELAGIDLSLSQAGAAEIATAKGNTYRFLPINWEIPKTRDSNWP
jgi:hypothetical protein